MKFKNLPSIKDKCGWVFITIALLFSACSTRYDSPHHYYIPHESNALKLTQKHEWIASGSIGKNTFLYERFTPQSINFENHTVRQWSSNFQMAYSPIKHLGIFGSHARLDFRDMDDTSMSFYQSHLTSFGAGTYLSHNFALRPIDKILPENERDFGKIIFDIYGGYTFGKFENNFFLGAGDDAFEMSKIYYQLGFHWEIGSFGLSYIHKRGKGIYLNGTINGESSFLQNFNIQNILDKNQIKFSENSFQIDYKRKYIGIYGQYTLSKIREFGFTREPVYIINFGVTLNIHDFNKKLRKK